VAESVHDGLTTIEQGRVAHLNDRVCEIADRPRGELATLSCVDLTAPEERRCLRQALEEARRDGGGPISVGCGRSPMTLVPVAQLLLPIVRMTFDVTAQPKSYRSR
jgi:PAS domain-containing protein